MSLNPINDSATTRLLQKRLLAEVKTLTTAVKDDNALMAGNAILASMQRLETLRTEYAVAAWEARTAYFERADAATAAAYPPATRPVYPPTATPWQGMQA